MIDRHRLSRLSVSAWIGAPPNARSVRSKAITIDAIVRYVSTTRQRDHASHAQNNTVDRPATIGPSP
jgi:hypothetical protein